MKKTKNNLFFKDGLPHEEISCPHCNHKGQRLLYHAPSFSMVRCKECGFCYQNPRITEAFMRDYYQQLVSRRVVPQVPTFNSRHLAEKRFLEYQDTLRYASKFVTTPGTVLEVGGFDGLLLYLAKNQGWKVFGVEIAEDLARFQREKIGIDTRVGILEEAGFDSAWFDLVVTRHVLEHIFDLNSFIKEVYRILKKGGLFLIEVPNLQGFEYRLRNTLAKLSLSKPSWEKMNLPQHLYCFTPNMLMALLTKWGFEILSWTTYSHRKHRSNITYQILRLRHFFVQGTKMRLIARKV